MRFWHIFFQWASIRVLYTFNPFKWMTRRRDRRKKTSEAKYKSRMREEDRKGMWEREKNKTKGENVFHANGNKNESSRTRTFIRNDLRWPCWAKHCTFPMNVRLFRFHSHAITDFSYVRPHVNRWKLTPWNTRIHKHFMTIQSLSHGREGKSLRAARFFFFLFHSIIRTFFLELLLGNR